MSGRVAPLHITLMVILKKLRKQDLTYPVLITYICGSYHRGQSSTYLPTRKRLMYWFPPRLTEPKEKT